MLNISCCLSYIEYSLLFVSNVIIIVRPLFVFNIRNSKVSTFIIYVVTRITTHLLTLEGWKAEVGWLANPLGTVYPQSGHLSTVHWA